MPTIVERLKSSWNAFFNNKDPSQSPDGQGFYYRPDRIRMFFSNEKTIISSIYNRIAVDVADVDIEHVRVDQNKRYVETINGALNDRLTISANIDQDSRTFIQDTVTSLLDEGYIAIVPIDTSENFRTHSSFEIYSMRVGQIIQWFPNDIRVRVYNDRTGNKEEFDIPKRATVILQNPFYNVMNESNSTLKRLSRKLTLLDVVDEQSASGKLDLIIQLPFSIKTELQRQQASQRKKDIEMQLAGSKYGIAYIDATEKVTQLNRPVENTLQAQVEYLTKLLYSELGLTEEVMNGSADEKTMVNYYNRVVSPILSVITKEMTRKWLTTNAITKGERVEFFRNPFKLITLDKVAEIGEKFVHNEVMSPNEVRGIVGLKPSDDPSSDEIRNRDLYPGQEQLGIQNGGNSAVDQINYLTDYEDQLNKMQEELNNV